MRGITKACCSPSLSGKKKPKISHKAPAQEPDSMLAGSDLPSSPAENGTTGSGERGFASTLAPLAIGDLWWWLRLSPLAQPVAPWGGGERGFASTLTSARDWRFVVMATFAPLAQPPWCLGISSFVLSLRPSPSYLGISSFVLSLRAWVFRPSSFPFVLGYFVLRPFPSSFPFVLGYFELRPFLLPLYSRPQRNYYGHGR